MSKLGTRMRAGASWMIPGHFDPTGYTVTVSDDLAMTEGTPVVAGSATAKVVSDSLALADVITARGFTMTDAVAVDDIANADAGVTSVPAPSTGIVFPGITQPTPPRVYHVFSSDGGTDTPPVRDWFAEETAPGGFGAAGGTIEATRVHDQPGVYTPGSLWQMWTEDGFLTWEGVLSNAIMHDESAELVGRGWRYLAERDAGRLLFMTHPEMVSGDSDPFNINISDSYEMDSSGSRVAFIGRKGEDVAKDVKTGAAFWAEGAELTSVAFTVSSNGFGEAEQDVFILTGIGPSPNYSDLKQEGGKVTLGAGDVNRRLNATRDGDMLWLELHRGSATPDGGLRNTVKVTLTNLRVRGISGDDDMAYSQVAREVCARLGVSDLNIHDTGDNILPLDWTDGSFAELLDYGAMVSGTRWLFRSTGQGPVCEVGEWDDVRWYTSRADGPTDLVPVSRYNAVVVSYPTHNGRHRTHTTTARDLDLADPFAATGYVNAFHIEIDQKQADSDLAMSIGTRLLAYLIKPRMSGTLTRTFVEGSTGHAQPAYRARAGDTIVVSDGLPGGSITVRVARKRSTAEGVQFDLDDRIAEVDAFLERRKKRITVQG